MIHLYYHIKLQNAISTEKEVVVWGLIRIDAYTGSQKSNFKRT